MRLKPSGLTPKPPEESGQNASAEFNVHSFIVKVWIEEDATKNSGRLWHGTITHVPSGERRYLKNLGEITAFIEPYLKAMGIRFGLNE
ncbi:MAG TPA: hypothetical protein VLB68_26185 [Pyrinomonadaceae bacterium]|nr:hypothetical protein [Pyrinomonadaceae bacterium]